MKKNKKIYKGLWSSRNGRLAGGAIRRLFLDFGDTNVLYSYHEKNLEISTRIYNMWKNWKKLTGQEEEIRPWNVRQWSLSVWGGQIFVPAVLLFVFLDYDFRWKSQPGFALCEKIDKNKS